MYDLKWNIETQDLDLSGAAFDNSFDIETTVNPSVQNGGIILEGRGFNITTPNYGIAVQQLMNGSVPNSAFQMNRWKQMCLADQAIKALWSYNNTTTIFTWAINYTTA